MKREVIKISKSGADASLESFFLEDVLAMVRKRQKKTKNKKKKHNDKIMEGGDLDG